MATEKKSQELAKAISLIDRLVSAINVLPCYWAEFVGLDFALEIAKFMARYDDDWQELVDEMEGEEE